MATKKQTPKPAEVDEVDEPRTDEEHEEARATDPVAALSYANTDPRSMLEGLKQETVGYDRRIAIAKGAGDDAMIAKLEDRKKQVDVERERVEKAVAAFEKANG